MLLFLDFDGVLHPALWPREPDFCRLPLFEAVLRAAPRVRIVISSTWREAFGLAELRSRFSADIAARIVGATPVLPGRSRHAEIMAYLQRHATHATQWVALDDTPEQFPRGCPYLIRCDPRSGLTEAVARELARRLAEMEASASLPEVPVVDATVSEAPTISRALVIHLRQTFRLNWHGAHGVAHWARVRVHDLEHTFGQRLRAAGVSFEDRQILLGHKNDSVTTHYSAPDVANLIAAANRVTASDRRKIDATTILRRKAG